MLLRDDLAEPLARQYQQRYSRLRLKVGRAGAAIEHRHGVEVARFGPMVIQHLFAPAGAAARDLDMTCQ